MSRALNWVFTLNNYEALLDPSTWLDCVYCVYQEEVGASGTRHLQGYIQFETRKRLSQISACPGLESAHVEASGGTAEQAEHYASKPHPGCQCQHCTEVISGLSWVIGGPYRWGSIRKGQQGKRSDLASLQRQLDDPSIPMVRIYRENFSTMSRVERFAVNYRRRVTEPRSQAPLVFTFLGAPGLGKSKTAYLLAQYISKSIYFVSSEKGSGLYWDDYEGQDIVIIDEFGGERCTPKFFNQLVDRYPFTVPTHGGAGHQFTSPFIFITSNLPPSDWWKNSKNVSVGATLRRINYNFVFHKPPRRTDRGGNPRRPGHSRFYVAPPAMELHPGDPGFPE